MQIKRCLNIFSVMSRNSNTISPPSCCQSPAKYRTYDLLEDDGEAKFKEIVEQAKKMGGELCACLYPLPLFCLILLSNMLLPLLQTIYWSGIL